MSLLSSENIKNKIESLLDELQKKTGVTEKELDEFKKILNLADFSQNDD